MKEHYDVIENTLDLLPTLEEGLAHARTLLILRKHQDAFLILQDTVEGILSIEKALLPVLADVKGGDAVDGNAATLRESIDKLIKDYESNKGENASRIMQQHIQPSFKYWKEEIERLLKPIYNILTKLIANHGRGESMF